MTDESRNRDETDDNGSAFERFERLAKHLVSVPKAEVDERRKQLKRRRFRKPAEELPHPRSGHNGGE